MVKRSLCGVMLLVLLPTLLFAATTGKISGRITDQETGDPLPGVNVVISGTTMGGATDINGEYFILNVPAGTYDLKATMIGYSTVTVRQVRVSVDLTTNVNIKMGSEVLDMGQSVTIVAERPLIQKDMTASRKITTAEEVMAAPVEDVQGAVRLAAGVTGDNFRGGRSGEAIYMLDGVAVMDPMTNTFESDVPLMSLEEVSVMTGGFSAEYGNAQSGIVNMVTKEGGTSAYHGALRYKTNDFGSTDINEKFGHAYTALIDEPNNKMKIGDFQRAENLQNLEWSFGGPEPITKYLFNRSNPITFFASGELYDSDSRFPGQYDKKGSVNTKVAWSPKPGYKLAFTGMRTWRKTGLFSNSWKNTTREAEKGMDLNHDGDMTDEFSMLDHLYRPEYATSSFGLTWTHTLSSNTFYEVQLSRYMTQYHYNIKENINEDTDGDGHLDLYDKVAGIDLDGDGDNRHEDINGNNIWDWKVYGEDEDLFRDENDNDFIDASENGPRSSWIPWASIPFGNYQDQESFYEYGIAPNLSYYRLRWNNDQKFTYSAKLDFTSQITQRQQIKTGIQFDYMDIKDHDVDLASGGNVYGTNIHVYPSQGGAYINDKMEYEGMILNLGFRFDYFNANFDNYPSDLRNPVPDSLLQDGGVVLNPRSVDPKFYWSPRIGVAFPFTDRDNLVFNYGKYFQTPQLVFLFQNINFDFSGAFPMVGNPDIDPERTTAYEISWTHQFSTDAVLTLRGYYKDITGLTDTQQSYYTFTDYYTYFVNTDYGNVRGFEFEIYKRRSPQGFLSGTMNYTYGVAKGKSSSYRQNYDLTWSGDVIPTTENYLDWDVRHSVKANIDLRVPSKRHLLGTTILDDLGINTIFNFATGRPYSPPARTKEPLINTERLPYIMSVDLTLDKRISLGGNRHMTFFVWVDNLFDMKNFTDIADASWYYTFTNIQNSYDDGDLSKAEYMTLMDVQDPYDFDNDGLLDEPDGEIDYNKKNPEVGSRSDPTVYDWGRTMRFGLRFEF
ncbi:TonB-dependent receptor [candidate division KSB1 bacterium]|nr:TonB-dependent receptor [candidate division KSB1 bacterium]